MHSSQFQKKFKVNYLLQIMTIHFAMRDTNTHTHTHTHTYTPLRIWAVCHTAKIDSTVGLAVQGVQKLTYKAQSPQYQVQHILVKRLKT